MIFQHCNLGGGFQILHTIWQCVCVCGGGGGGDLTTKYYNTNCIILLFPFLQANVCRPR